MIGNRDAVLILIQQLYRVASGDLPPLRTAK